MVADIDGRWIDGRVRGHLFDAVWSGYDGYPGFRPDPLGPWIAVRVLVSDHWGRHWERLDRFEGPGYRRTEIEVFARRDASLIGTASIYECLAGR